ncbi:hypothetical protein V7793_02760 [Streptomyces sp. KLMMK]|uniref:hypothetical protein n=1 Tax=Streptomyces sp. KLMMK TaxID=3109353 RepID=UPI002FFE4973
MADMMSAWSGWTKDRSGSLVVDEATGRFAVAMDYNGVTYTLAGVGGTTGEWTARPGSVRPVTNEERRKMGLSPRAQQC